MRFLLILTAFFAFCASKPLSEVIKDIEVSGEANYKYDYIKQESKKPKQEKKAKN